MNNKYSTSEHQRKKLINASSMRWFHWFIVVLSIILTIGAWYFSKQQLAEKNENKFQRDAAQAVELVKERMELYENALRGGVAHIDSNQGQINYKSWLAYSKSLHIEKSYPGINGIGVIFNIKPAQLENYLERESMDRPDYKIHPQHSESEYWPITYIEPAAPNIKAVGLDMAFETNRYSAIKKARDTGEPQLTGPITLVQDAKQTPGFLFYTPFYKNGNKAQNVKERQSNIIGVTYAPFIMLNLMQGTLAKHKRQVRITISDQDQLLYDDVGESKNIDIDSNPLFRKAVKIDIYGRIWTFDIQSNLSFRAAAENYQPYLILMGGLLIDALLLGLFIFLSKANRTALSYADQMVIELKDKTSLLEQSNQDLEQFAYVASHDLKSPLNAINHMVGWIEEDCAGLLPEESRKHLRLLKQRSQRMNKLLDDLLEYARISRLISTYDSVNLKQISNNIFELLGAPSNFTCIAPDTTINIPRIAFEIVLRNLISNAIKHHDLEQGKIIIHYQLLADFHRVIVDDDGPGIPEELQGKALEMFQTLQPRDKVEGSGMGLAISKKIVFHHGGHLSIDSKNERGTCIIIDWPLEVDKNPINSR